MSAARTFAACLLLAVLLAFAFVVLWPSFIRGQIAVPSYRLVFHNRYVQVFDLQLAPGRQAPIHDNTNDLLWVSLDSGILEFESRDGTARQLQFEAGDVRLFPRREVKFLRNKTAGPVHSVLLELPRLDKGGCGCSTEVERVVCGWPDAGRLPRYWALALRGATLAETTLEPGQSLNEVTARNDTLLVAIFPVQLRHKTDTGNRLEQGPSSPAPIALNPGGVEWLPQGRHQLTNLADKPARFITIEFYAD